MTRRSGGPVRATDLVATRFALPPDAAPDPFALAGGDGILFRTEGRLLVGVGSASTIPLRHGLDDATELAAAIGRLAAIPCDDRAASPGAGVLAFGALPFDRSAPAALTIPEVLVGIEPTGAAWVTVVGPGGPSRPGTPDEVARWLRARGTRSIVQGPAPEVTSLSAADSPESFETMVDDALAAILRGEVVKVVLARQLDALLRDPVDIPALLRRWGELEPDCTLFSLPGAGGQFVGASPELLVQRSGLRVRSHPLAGTSSRPAPGREPVDDLLPPELTASEKDATEHRLVVDAIAERLGLLCTELDVPSVPELVRLHNLVHLGTPCTGTLARRAGQAVPSALELVGALHPTPAVGGVPDEASRALITRLEPRSRGSYAGPVGYVDAGGDGTWVLGIRAASIRDRTARLTAGVGVVRGSEPRVELAETNLKFNAVFDALVPGFRLAMPPARPRHPAVS